ncbi:hypothetical protein [Galbibacter orientalis]|uniref:hypothetical protein n=1 Tax=Galbibacter orientalis TaxID=453852 RepID=UPI003000FABA
MKTLRIRVCLFMCFLISISVFSQEAEGNAAQANNPLANMTALNFHDYYMPKLSNAPDDAYMNTAWVRFAKPLSGGKLLLRVSTPISTIGLPEVNGNVKTLNGLGDMNAFMSYNFVSNPTTTMGAGPLITAPTSTNQALGTGKWQAGFAFVAFFAKSPIFQYGALVTWQTSFAGQSDRESTNNAAFQPFYFWQLGKGLYLRGAPIWYFDIKNDAYSVPIALGIGKVIKLNDTMINCFIEPQYSMLTAGTQPIFQVFTGINLQFM